MAPIVARLTSKGQVTLPRRLREALGVKPGDYLALTPTPVGVLISAADVSARRLVPTNEGERLLFQLVREIGAQLEAQGITEEEQLDEEIDAAKREAHQELYGRISD